MEVRMFLIDSSPDDNGDQFRIDSIENYYYVMQYMAHKTLELEAKHPGETTYVCFPVGEDDGN